MRYFLTAFSLVLVCKMCIAGELRQYDRNSPKHDDTRIVGIECNKKNNILQLGFFDAYNVPSKRMDLWDTFELKKNNSAGDAVEKVLSVVRHCRLGKYDYEIKITGVPGNWNLNGGCGGDTYPGAKIWKNGTLIFDENISDCKNVQVLTTITFSSKVDTPVRKKGATLSELFD